MASCHNPPNRRIHHRTLVCIYSRTQNIAFGSNRLLGLVWELPFIAVRYRMLVILSSIRVAPALRASSCSNLYC